MWHRRGQCHGRHKATVYGWCEVEAAVVVRVHGTGRDRFVHQAGALQSAHSTWG